ncbi:hypothetical protein EB118_24940 [bacterium]|nr:hypothetical protein [bacterium]
MPTVSTKQEKFMQAVAHNPKFAKKVGVPQSVGKEFTGMKHGSRPSHRVSALLHDLIESIHSTLHVLHTCDNPKCCNPKHLFTGTNADNVADRTAKGRTKTPLQYGALNSMSKLTIEQVRQIRGLYFASRFSQSQLAKKYGVRQSHVSRLVNGLRWGEML